MSQNGLQPVLPDKRSLPIVQSPGRNEVVQVGATGRVRRAGSQRQARIALFVILVMAAVLAAGYFAFIPREETRTVGNYSLSTVAVATLQDTVELSGVVSARAEAAVTAPESGTMGLLLVAEGEWVTNGQLVAILETEELQDQLDSKRLQLQREQRDFDRFLLQHEYDLRRFDRKRENLSDTTADAREELADTQELYDLGSASLSELEEWQDKVDTAQDAIEDHDAEVEEALAIHELTKGNYEDDRLTIREDINDLEERILDARVTSPMTGRVVSITDAATTNGARIVQYQTLMEIADSRNPLILSEIEEQYVDLISVGQPVAVEISGTRVVGAIERIGLTAQSSSDGGTPTVELDIAIDVGDAEIISGTSTIVEVLIGEIANAIVLPRGPYLTSRNRKYLYRVDGQAADRVEVTFGMITDNSVQILTGVEPGDQIITSSYTNFIDYKTVQIGGNE
ncbi:MAG: HlyD family efflux transporter periplasmic adaptor subunit [Spirochaetia bacterium]